MNRMVKMHLAVGLRNAIAYPVPATESTAADSRTLSLVGAPPLSWVTASRYWLAAKLSDPVGIDPDGLKSLAVTTVRAHWFVIALCLVELLYRPYYGYVAVRFAIYLAMLLILIGLNGYLHYRLRSNRSLTPHWLLALYALDLLLISAAAAISGGFSHLGFHLFYYPALAAFAVMFTSFWLNMLWATLASIIYVSLSLGIGGGLDMEARDEKVLLLRIAIMYAVVVVVNMASRFERARWEQAVEREQEIQRERAEMSRTIHDTIAQTSYMIGLGIYKARRLAGESNEDLNATLDATADLSKSVVWELRHPLDAGQIYEGASLGALLESHTATFTTVTSVPAEVVLRGVEPALTMEVRNRLFSIAHNALTNAFRHAHARGVGVELDFGTDAVRLSVSDDGVGLPDDYDQRGQGFAGMRADAEAIGGSLNVETGGKRGGTTINCTVPR